MSSEVLLYCNGANSEINEKLERKKQRKTARSREKDKYVGGEGGE